MPLPLILLAVIASGATLGAVNGVMVWKLGIPSIVVTLGTMTIYRGTIFLLTGGAWINAHQMSAGFKAFPRAGILGLPVMAWIAIAVIAAMAVLVNRTALGRALFAVGGNREAARRSGINVNRSCTRNV